jgi:NADH:ubiquinone oxidoreductase subunit F (NADH-binding)
LTSLVDAPTAALARLGSPHGRLLAGKAGREGLAEHRDRLGSLPVRPAGGSDLFDVIRASGLAGRGGGYFPLAAKVASSRSAPGRPVVVINGTESEPASGKDRLLLESRPHLVLDGGQALAATVGADRLIVVTHAGATSEESLREACAERGLEAAAVTVAAVPDRYVAGESSAVVSFLNGGPALPASRSQPTAVRGVGGRPTVVSNAETVSHVALIARFGPDWFRAAGSPSAPGSVLLTVTGDVRDGPAVVEVLEPITIGEAISAAGGVELEPAAILLGGYAGTWLAAGDAMTAPVDAAILHQMNAPLGCGLVGVLGPDRCGVVEAARLLKWLSGERAGQCGACALGLPELADRLEGLAAGTGRRRREIRRIVTLGLAVSGRGLCHLPDGAAAMAESALGVFSEEFRLHRRRQCLARRGPVFPIRDGATSGRS